ncbi:VIT1/CCC1 transporter family protein [Ignicoccus hospitalis]|uniref:Rubrerythrin diiron-binding domain-containing protein n=1 Tax=Ignicoccus hospitalis (strain KIN4/I / DSM 18386 / JCM 14125) TaxID=453591 RepID=A8AC34_IGNH4|nr:VIT1/CCC1 family protein [Ignicoccus hospitalis]ABU82486.1 protein of unknown function DUF125, transmembrane [Ignicoccus hospitalis KIN4/I]HIH90583.1 rubrerythrin family protein [Desulfurococcaceae archaeon]
MNKEAVAEAGCKAEKAAWIVYSELAKMEKDERTRKLLSELAEDERRHYEFWRSVLGRECEVKVNKFLLKVMRRLFGPLFILKKMESGEEVSAEFYKNLLESEEFAKEKEEIKKILEDELKHEKKLVEMVEDARAKYVGYVALGLADSVVEITGVHAGFLGATDNPVVAGMAGLIVGFSASLSMGSAAYVQAKHDPSVRPPVSAAVTMISYLLSVILLALPYFLIGSVAIAFGTSLLLAMLIMGLFIYYSATIQEKDFKREYLETVSLLLATAIGSYVFGKVLETILNVKVVE